MPADGDEIVVRPASIMRATADQLDALETVTVESLSGTILGDALTGAEIAALVEEGADGVDELVDALRATADRWEARDAR